MSAPLLDIARRIAYEEEALNQTVDLLLDLRRPDRYTPGVDDEWLDEISRDPAVLEHVHKIEALKRIRSVVLDVEGIEESP